MSYQDRKTFIKQLGLTGMALLLQQVNLFGRAYNKLDLSNDNVTFYESGSEAYEALRKGFNKRINRYPKLIALCSNTQGVVEAIQYAAKNNLPVTVKSGGHCMEGFSCNDGGMVINLSLLNKLSMPDSKTLSVEPACLLKTIYETLIPKAKYLPGGSCQSVAIGGLALGGGYGLMSRNYGLTCDSLLEATMVTASGKVVNTKDDPELLWALKGGGNGNFGVVTQMKFKVQKAPASMISFKFRSKNTTVENAVETCRQWFERSATLPLTCFSAFIFNGRTTYILLTNTGKNNASVNEFIDYFKAGSTKFSKGNPLPLGRALKAYYGESRPVTFKNASAGLYKDFTEIESVIGMVFALVKKKPGILYQVNTLGGVINSPEQEAASAFPHRQCAYFSELQAYWDSEQATQGFLDHFELIQQQFTAAGIRAQYRNYPDINFTNWGQLYYGKNLDRLLALKRRYDPGNTFSGPQTLTI
ncbi:MAG: FAD-binding oxidoreductase [Bacteroidetes bacterium]|nr:FAD-binding oxidoreductase [Bacteroidota bacterium]